LAVGADIRLAAAVDAPVLITGCSASERVRCAYLIHDTISSGRRPFIVLDGSGGTPTADPVAPSRVTGPVDITLRGGFERAHGGTLFVDHLDRLPFARQTEFLDLLETRAHVGSAVDAAAVGVRIITGASRCFATERTIGAFSNRLFYRLNVIHIDLTADAT
jgi:DNA-binding NtrC family response regulator